MPKSLAGKKSKIKKESKRSSLLGTGGAKKAEGIIVKRRRENCQSRGGTWNPRTLRCE